MLDIKKGDNLIYKNERYNILIGYKIIEVEKVLKTKLKCVDGMEILKSEYYNLEEYNAENLEKVRNEYKEQFKNNHRNNLKKTLNSKLKIEAYYELIMEMMEDGE